MSQIKIYSRVRPTSKPFKGLHLSRDESSLSINIGFYDNVSKRPQSRYSQAPPSSHQFKFSRVFDQEASQEEVFEYVACHMIDSFLGGYNGTIFAYGQTSSGKTYTIEGSSRSYAERGLIPRTISHVFEDVERRRGMGEDVTVHVSYMEIYQDVGYDLLNPGTRPGALMVTLPKVQVIEGVAGEVVVRNLSVHLAASEEVALSLLFQGSTCRRVAETSMNQRSSRSHTIFTLCLTAKSPGKEATLKSKLHLVDLAGSERVAKTGADGLILQEAKHINLSLHHLEHVIVSLQQLARHKHGNGVLKFGADGRGNSVGSPLRHGQSHRDRSPGVSGLTSPTHLESAGGHVPYRNSMLTMVLRDSLGGNCLTAMIATISAEEKNIWESVSTCRFSQRVACISNQAKRNEELDDKVVIKKLRKKVAELEAELTAHKMGTSRIAPVSRQSLSSADQKVCHQILNDFFHGRLDNPVQAGINTTAKFQECLFVMREIVLHALGIQKQQQLKKSQGMNRTTEKGRKQGALDEESVPMPRNGLGQGEMDLVDLEVSADSQSRLSSGFGSLQEVGSSCRLSDGWCQKEHGKQKSRGRRSRKDRVKSEDGHREGWHHHKQAWTGTSQSPPATSTDSQDDNWITNNSSSTTSASSPTDQLRYPIPTDTPTGPNIQHSVSPYTHVPSPTDKFQHRHKYSLMRRSPSSNRRRTPSEGGSSMQAALEGSTGRPGHTELQQSREEENRLQQHLHRAQLELQGQQVMDALGALGEKLASQHALVKRMEKTGTSGTDDVYAEKIVEQQLYIKQAKLHHRLRSIQQELTMSQGHTDTGRENASSVPSSSSTVSRDSEPREVKARSQRREERQRVEEELEHLKMSRKEKELQLREAATRMKIRALKQQLMGNTSHLEGSTALGGRDRTGEPHPPDEYSNTGRHHNLNNSEDKQQFLLQAQQILNASEDNHSLSGATPPTSQVQPNSPATRSSHQVTPLSLATPPSIAPSLAMAPNHLSATSSSHHQAPPGNQRPLPIHTPPPHSVQTHTPSSHLVQNHNTSLLSHTPSSATLQQPSASAGVVVTPASQPKVLQKLTLPEEIKETEYMSAVQRQKVRVNRIRRCIVAATVIQRAWRRHSKHSFTPNK